jgi:ABC-2 type transport system permease protein
VDSEAEMRALIDNNSARAGLVIPPGFENQIASGQTGIVAFIIDGTDPTVAGTAQSAAVLIGQYQATQLSVERLNQQGMASLFLPAVEVRTQVLYNPAMVSAYFMIPALIGMIMQFLTTFLTATSIVRERERGTIEQLIVTPIRPWELVVGKLVPYVFISFLDALLILVAGVLVFGIPFNGSLVLFSWLQHLGSD